MVMKIWRITGAKIEGGILWMRNPNLRISNLILRRKIMLDLKKPLLGGGEIGFDIQCARCSTYIRSFSHHNEGKSLFA